MKKLIQPVSHFFLFYLLTSTAVTAQDSQSNKQVTKRIDAAQATITKALNILAIDNADKMLIRRYVALEIDSMQLVIKKDNKLDDQQKIKDLTCQAYFLETLKTEIERKPVDVFQIQENHTNFLPLWQRIHQGQSIDSIVFSLTVKTADIMAVIFRGYPATDVIKDISTLKSMERNPTKIMSFLSTRPVYRFRDSLIFIVANTLPEQFLNTSKSSKDPELLKSINEHGSPLIKTLLLIRDEKDYLIYLPFAGQLAQNKTTLAEINTARLIPSNYFKLMVNAEMENQALFIAGKNPIYRFPLRTYLKKYSILFFTDVINSLHEETSEKARYYVLDDLRPQDLYFVLTEGENNIYTSSYLYTYKKLMGSFQKNHYDSLFQLVNYSRYRKFMLLAGRYNTISEFMNQMSNESRGSVINRFMKNLEINEGGGFEETINVAESFPGIVKDKQLVALADKEIESNYLRTKSISSFQGMKLYSVLKGLMTAVKNNELGNNTGLNPVLAVYYKLSNQTLTSNSGMKNQMALFYGDEDGRASYASFLTNFSDAGKWTIQKNESWVTIKSKKGAPMTIYANLPLTDAGNLDIMAQEALKSYLVANAIRPRILIHRGHSYHLNNSILSVTDLTELAILGSCGGYTEIFEILKKNPAAQVISTKQIGSKQVNEPMLKIINERLLNGKDLFWPEIWAELDKLLKPNKLAYDYFQEYVPPYKNIALLVATLYNTDKTPIPVETTSVNAY